jgi:hypothetical protein
MVDTLAALPRPRRRTRRLAHFLGPDWKVALPFVLPMAALMLGLILWPFVSASA